MTMFEQAQHGPFGLTFGWIRQGVSG